MDFERLAKKSLARKRPPSKEQQDREMKLFGEVRNRKPRFETFEKRLKHDNLYDPVNLWDEILMSDDKEKYMEELRKQNQAELSQQLLKNTGRRLGVFKPIECYNIPEKFWHIFRPATTPVTSTQRLKVLRNCMQLSVSLHPCTVRDHGELEIGDLQAHTNGLRFLSSNTTFKINVMYDNVKRAFFQDGNKEMAISSLLHFHLHNPTMLGGITTKDIQFRMLPQTSGLLALDSDKLDEFAVGNQLVQKFVWEFNFLQKSFTSTEFQKMERNLGFHAKLPVKTLSTFFVMTYDSLVHLEETPFFVVTKKEMEVVNLVRTQPGSEVFDITIVFKDFSLDVCYVNSIPAEYFTKIKQWLDMGNVKYYENEKDISNWRDELKAITDVPKVFIENGGWEFLLNRGKNVVMSDESDS